METLISNINIIRCRRISHHRNVTRRCPCNSSRIKYDQSYILRKKKEDPLWSPPSGSNKPEGFTFMIDNFPNYRIDIYESILAKLEKFKEIQVYHRNPTPIERRAVKEEFAERDTKLKAEDEDRKRKIEEICNEFLDKLSDLGCDTDDISYFLEEIPGDTYVTPEEWLGPSETVYSLERCHVIIHFHEGNNMYDIFEEAGLI